MLPSLAKFCCETFSRLVQGSRWRSSNVVKLLRLEGAWPECHSIATGHSSPSEKNASSYIIHIKKVDLERRKLFK